MQFDAFLEVFKLVAGHYGRKGVFSIDDENREQIKYLLLYFSNNRAFNEITPNNVMKYKPDLEKGLILAGNVGSGKTNLLRIFQEMRIPSNYFRIAYCDVITDDYRRLGMQSLFKYYNSNLERIQHDTSESIFLFDDLGFEKKFKDYGTKVNCLMDIIIKRERLYNDYGTRSLFTTNLMLSEIESYYDNRTLSRLCGMCNVIYLGNKSDSIDRRIN